MQSDGGELFPYFGQRCFTEVADFQQLVFGSLHEISHVTNSFALQAVVSTNRQLQVIDKHIELGLKLSFCASGTTASDGMNLSTQFARLYEWV
jgi:hypothetical protein